MCWIPTRSWLRPTGSRDSTSSLYIALCLYIYYAPLTGESYGDRLIKTLAEYNAIEDALYFLDRALSNGEMELAVFLKEVRKLARKQFMCQALIQRVRSEQHKLATPAYQVPSSSATVQ